jgi:hypothetical protein
MPQPITLNPSLKVLLPEFKKMCAEIQQYQNTSTGGISIDMVRELRSTFVAPLVKPRKGTSRGRAQLLATLSVVIDLLMQGWRISNTDPVILDFPEWSSAEDEKHESGKHTSSTVTRRLPNHRYESSSFPWKSGA